MEWVMMVNEVGMWWRLTDGFAVFAEACRAFNGDKNGGYWCLQTAEDMSRIHPAETIEDAKAEAWAAVYRSTR